MAHYVSPRCAGRDGRVRWSLQSHYSFQPIATVAALSRRKQEHASVTCVTGTCRESCVMHAGKLEVARAEARENTDCVCERNGYKTLGASLDGVHARCHLLGAWVLGEKLRERLLRGALLVVCLQCCCGSSGGRRWRSAVCEAVCSDQASYIVELLGREVGREGPASAGRSHLVARRRGATQKEEKAAAALVTERSTRRSLPRLPNIPKRSKHWTTTCQQHMPLCQSRRSRACVQPTSPKSHIRMDIDECSADECRRGRRTTKPAAYRTSCSAPVPSARYLPAYASRRTTHTSGSDRKRFAQSMP